MSFICRRFLAKNRIGDLIECCLGLISSPITSILRIGIPDNLLVFVAAGTWCRVSLELLAATGSKAVFRTGELTLMGMGAWTWKRVQFFKHGTLLSAQLVLSSLILYVLYQRLISAWAWRVFHGVDWPFDCGVLRAVLAHVRLCQVVRAWTWRRWNIVLLLWSLLRANSIIQRGDRERLLAVYF